MEGHEWSMVLNVPKSHQESQFGESQLVCFSPLDKKM